MLLTLSTLARTTRSAPSVFPRLVAQPDWAHVIVESPTVPSAASMRGKSITAYPRASSSAASNCRGVLPPADRDARTAARSGFALTSAVATSSTAIEGREPAAADKASRSAYGTHRPSRPRGGPHLIRTPHHRLERRQGCRRGRCRRAAETRARPRVFFQPGGKQRTGLTRPYLTVATDFAPN